MNQRMTTLCPSRPHLFLFGFVVALVPSALVFMIGIALTMPHTSVTLGRLLMAAGLAMPVVGGASLTFYMRKLGD